MHPDSLFEGLVGVDSGCRLLCWKVGGGSKRGVKAHKSLRLVMKDKFICGIKINLPIFCFSFKVKHDCHGLKFRLICSHIPTRLTPPDPPTILQPDPHPNQHHHRLRLQRKPKWKCFTWTTVYYMSQISLAILHNTFHSWPIEMVRLAAKLSILKSLLNHYTGTEEQSFGHLTWLLYIFTHATHKNHWYNVFYRATF